MERLTYDFCIAGKHCWQVKGTDNLECGEVCKSRDDEGCNGCPIADAFDRLAAIEDILGDDYDLDRLKELAEADGEGRCVVLPCRVGDTLYYIGGTYKTLIKPVTVEEVYIGDGVFAVGVSSGFKTFTLQEKEWYKSKKEAEAAMKRMEGEEK